MKIDPVELAEALSSRIAHEMVGPVGAISNGLELMRELGPEAGEDVAALIDNSSKTAGARLQFYRLAYGRAGMATGSIAQFRSAATEFLARNEAHTLTWPMPPVQPTLPDGAGRIALILIEIAQGALIRGGNIAIRLEEDGVFVTATGDDLTLGSEIRQAFDGGEAMEIGPSNVHAVLAALFSDAISWRISSAVESGNAIFSAQSSGS